MAFLDLPIELILLILATLSETDLAHLLQVHRSLYAIVLPYLYRRHLEANKNNSNNTTTNNPRNGANRFFYCVATRNIAAVQRFLTYGADVNAVVSAASMWQAGIYATKFVPWHDVQAPLNMAANMGDDTLVSLLLGYGASVNGSNIHPGDGGGRRIAVQPAIVDALLSNHLSTVRLLLQHNSPLSGSNMERGGLVNCAIAREHLSILEMLVCEFGADLNGTWQEGVYPLNRAVWSSGPRATEIVRFMLDHGADIGLANGGSSDDNMTGGGGQRLLNQAIRHGTIDTLRLLLNRGVVSPSTQPLDNNIFRTWIIERCTPETVHLLHEHGYFRALDKTQDDTLMIAVRARRGDILQLFIDSSSGLDVNLNARLTRGGSTLLHTAVVRCKPPREVARPSLSCILSPPPRPNVLVRNIEPDIDHSSVSSTRCMSENVEKCSPEEIVRCLVGGGADVNAKDERGITPLDLAEKSPEVVYKMLLDAST